jgi:hypothetical protein
MKKILLFFYVFTIIKSANLSVTLEPNGAYMTEFVNGGPSTTWAWATATWDIYVKLNPNLYWDGGSSTKNYSCGQFNNNNSVTITPCPSWLSSFYSNYNFMQTQRKNIKSINQLIKVDTATNTSWMLVQKQLGTSLVQIGANGEPKQKSQGVYKCGTLDEENESIIKTTCPWLATTTTN